MYNQINLICKQVEKNGSWSVTVDLGGGDNYRYGLATGFTLSAALRDFTDRLSLNEVENLALVTTNLYEQRD